jgi:hypothetical protein
MTFLRILPVALLAALSPRPATGAERPRLPLPIRIETLESVRVGEPREVWVSLPDGYDSTTDRFPVVYLLDGDFNFNSGTIGGLRHAAQLGELPEFILVGIKNTNRSKDVFPEEISYPDGTRDGGRANQYLDFIREELIPHVEKTYRTARYRVLYGTSNTGFTAVHALFRSPATADAYVAASATLSIPSFLEKRDELVRGFRGGKRQLALVMGERDLPTVIRLNAALKEVIDSMAPAGLSCQFAVIRSAEHVPPDSLLAGLRDLFDGWRITQRLTEGSFHEIRAQVDGRLARFGVAGALPEESLQELAEALLGERKYGKAVEVLKYRAQSHPQSAEAQVSLGDAHLQDGKPELARECYRKALALAPGHPLAARKLALLQ